MLSTCFFHAHKLNIVRSIKNQLQNTFFFLFLISFSIFQSCQKEDTDDYSLDGEYKILVRDKDDPRGQENRGKTSEIEKTVLGIKRNNPFAVHAVNKAMSQLYGLSSSPITKTHTYVKFLPTNQDHLAVLDAWESKYLIPIFDFPLEYEVIISGEYYTDPAVSDPLYTYQYTSIPIGTPMPENVPFENIEDLYLDKSNPLLIAQSFVLVGNDSEFDEYFNSGDGVNTDGFTPQEIEYITKPQPCPEGFHPILQINDGTIPVTYEWVCIPDYSGGGGPPLNECDCPVPADKSKPAGCVQVHDDDGLGIAVRSTTIKVKDNWYSSDFATTDKNGCWRIDESFSGKMKTWTVFKNAACKIRDKRFTLGAVVVKDYVGQISYPFNDQFVEYDRSLNNNNSNGRVYWAASHSINTIIDYRKRVPSDGIALPKNHLNILNLASDGDAAAPMLQKQSYPFVGIFYEEFLGGITVSALLPDIVNKYGLNEPSNVFTNTLVHELAHASHYAVVGEAYWNKFRTHIVLNLGYGTFGEFTIGSNPGTVALGEAFANYVETLHTGTSGGGENASFSSVDKFIPRGLFFDLMDTNPDIVVDPNDGSARTDNISGFTTSQMFFAMRGAGINDIRKFRNNLRTLFISSSGNNPTQFNLFVDQYDVFN